MSDNIDRYLDGELPLEALSPEERAEAARLEEAVEALAFTLRDAPAPDLTARVMAALPESAPLRAPISNPEREKRGVFGRALGWMWAPRPLRLVFRPAYALGGACALVLAATQLPLSSADPAVGPPIVVRPEAPAATPPVYVQFRLEAEGASSVALAGTFTGWKPEYPMEQTAPGEWSVLVPLRPGVHDYAFVIDGRRWVADPHAPQVDDDFGGTNSRISLPALGSHS